MRKTTFRTKCCRQALLCLLLHHGLRQFHDEEERRFVQILHDYRRLNAVTKKDAFPVADVKNALDSRRGAKYFAIIDLVSDYWQLGMTDRARECSAFCT